MDAFEDLVAFLFRNQGYWVEQSFKVRLEKSEKIIIGRPSSPRWEIDLLVYKAKSNELLVVECKSFLYSTGVSYSSFGEGVKPDRYKLFNDSKLREVVFGHLVKQLEMQNAILPHAHIQLCLVAGHIKSGDKARLEKLFSERGWLLFGEEWLVKGLQDLGKESYQNNVASMAAKLLR
ncbi:MAG: hypothetical protein ACRERZ_03115, partial [Gammaproteobacteria bacterium]